MGEVYRARHLRLQREIALKTLPDAATSDPERRERFRREALAVAALNHPHIVTIHSVEDADSIIFPPGMVWWQQTVGELREVCPREQRADVVFVPTAGYRPTWRRRRPAQLACYDRAAVPTKVNRRESWNGNEARSRAVAVRTTSIAFWLALSRCRGR